MGIEDVVAKAKAAATDERVDQVSEAIQKVAPDTVDPKVQQIAEQVKKHND